MSNVPKIISLFFLIVSLHSFGQYKRMSIGAEYGFTIIPKDNYGFKLFSLTGLSAQYNFKKICSIRSGFSFERNNFSKRIHSPNGEYPPHYDDLTVDSRFMNVPVILKATIGRRLNFFVNAGLNASFSLKSSYSAHIVTYLPGSPQVSDVSGTITADRKVNFTFVFGAGFSSTIKKRLTIYTEFRGMLRNGPLTNPPFYSFHNYYGVVLISGIAYQFNFSKKSDYAFSSYKIGIGKHTL